jgi:hypothetical protein
MFHKLNLTEEELKWLTSKGHDALRQWVIQRSEKVAPDLHEFYKNYWGIWRPNAHGWELTEEDITKLSRRIKKI